MSVLDPGGDLSDAEIQAALVSLRKVGTGQVPRVRKTHIKIKNRPKQGKVHPLEVPKGLGLNSEIEVTVRLPAYLVAGVLSETGLAGTKAEGPHLDSVVREALKEWLYKRGKTWWQPRFLSVVKARELEARERFTRSLD